MGPAAGQIRLPGWNSSLHEGMRGTQRAGALSGVSYAPFLPQCRQQRRTSIRCHGKARRTWGSIVQWGGRMLQRIAPELEHWPSLVDESAEEESSSASEGSEPEDEALTAAKTLMFASLLTWTERAAEQNPDPPPVAPWQPPAPTPREEPPQLGEMIKALATIAEVAVQRREEWELEDRRNAFRHLRHVREITMEWPPHGTPTWEDWLEKFEQTDQYQLLLDSATEQMQDAKVLGHFGEAAQHTEVMESIHEQDNVRESIKRYKEAVREEDYVEAAELGDRAGVGLLGWWWPQNTNCDNPSHLMRVSAAFDRYIFEVFTPDDIAKIHGLTPPPNGTSGPYTYENYSSRPDLEQYKHEGNLVAELHYKSFSSYDSDAEPSDEDREQEEGEGDQDEEEDELEELHEQATALALADHLVDLNQGGYGYNYSSPDDSSNNDGPLADGSNQSWNLTASGGPGQANSIQITIQGDVGDLGQILAGQPQGLGLPAGVGGGSSSSSVPRFHQPDEYTYLDRSGDASGSESDNEESEASSSTVAETDGEGNDDVRSGSDDAEDSRDGSSDEEGGGVTFYQHTMDPEVQRIPAQIIRFADRDRFMLKVLPTDAEEASIRESNDEWLREREEQARHQEAEEPEDKAEFKRKMQGIVMEKLQEAKSGSKRLMRLQQPQEQDYENAMSSGVEFSIPEMLMHLRERLGGSGGAQDPQAQYQYGLHGSVSYKRITPSELAAQRTDPFTGIFMKGSHNSQVHDIIRLQRVKGEDGKEFVEAIKLTGEEATPVGSVVFKAAIGRRHRLPLHDVYHSPIDIKARYKANTLTLQQGNQKPEWTEGELLEFGDSDYVAGAELGFTIPYSSNSDSVHFLMHRITLDDPLDGLCNS